LWHSLLILPVDVAEIFPSLAACFYS